MRDYVPAPATAVKRLPSLACPAVRHRDKASEPPLGLRGRWRHRNAGQYGPGTARKPVQRILSRTPSDVVTRSRVLQSSLVRGLRSLGKRTTQSEDRELSVA